MSGSASDRSKSQISFEFLVVYSFVVLVFAVIFLLVTSERASALNAESYSALQLVAQDVAGYLDQAVYAGSGYNISTPLTGSIGTLPYNITISSTGVVIVSSRVGSQVVSAYAFSSARSLIVNGTYSSQSTNSIQLYVLPSTGVFQVSNINGVLFVNRLPASTVNLASNLYARMAGKTLAGVFNGIVGGYSLAPAFAANLKAETVVAWIDPTAASESANSVVGFQNAGLSVGFGPSGNLYPCFFQAQTTVVCNPANIPTQTFTFVAGTYNSVSGVETLYINGQSVNSISGVNWAAGSSSTGIALGTDCFADETCLAPYMFNGIMTNVQIYNTSLSASQVLALYSQGISGPPVATQNVVAWYPLNGDTYDYGGNGYDVLIANGITYQYVVQVNAYPLLTNGSKVLIPALGQGLPVYQLTGFSSSAGTLSANGAYYGSPAPGVATAFLVSNGAHGLINLTVTEFNGNNTLINTNLIGHNGLTVWFPLNSGYGNTVYDMGPFKMQLQALNVYKGFPGWTAANRNITNFQAANFAGASSGGNIVIGTDSAYYNINNNGTFTAVAWVYYGGNDGYTQGVFGDLSTNTGTTANGFQIMANGLATGVFQVSNRIVNWPSGHATNLTAGSWVMITAEYNKASGVASVYLNSSLFAANTVGSGLLVTRPGPYIIGDDFWQSGQSGAMNGIISDVQLYSSYLNQSQVSALYSQGITGVPLQNTGLIGWWALDGSLTDLSSVGNQNSTIGGSAKFGSVTFTNYSLLGPSAYALSFNPVSANVYYAQGSGSASFTDIGGSVAANIFTIVAWIKPTPVQNSNTNSIFFSYGGDEASVGPGLALGIQHSGLPYFSAPSSASKADVFAPTSGARVNFNSWNFMAAEVSQQKISVFINGRWTNGTLQYTWDSGGPEQPLIVGGTTPGGGPLIAAVDVFNGSITDLQVYNTTLSQQQLLQLYEQGIPPVVRLNVSVK